MPCCVTDWRSKWSSHTEGATDPAFPFGWAQLNSNGAAALYTNPKNTPSAGDELGQWSNGFPSIRNAESHTLSLPNTFQAVILE